jgi:hypothetical protein
MLLKTLKNVQNINLFVSDTYLFCDVGCVGVCALCMLLAYWLLFFSGDRFQRERVHQREGNI